MVADIILFNDVEASYGETGVCGSADGTEQNERYINYALARLAGHTNVIWCMANEYDYPSIWANSAADTETAARNNGYSDGNGYTAADAQMNVLGTFLRNNDKYFNSDSISLAPRILSVHQHSQIPFPPPFLWWNLANTFNANWFTSAIIQDHIGTQGYPSYGDVNGNRGIVSNLGHNMPVVNDEYGYLDTRSDTRTIARNAIWAIVVGGGYGTFGGDCSSGDCAHGVLAPARTDIPAFSGDWVSQPYYNDISVLTRFMNTTSYWQKTSANSKISALNGARAYASGPASLSTGAYVVYVAQPASSGPSFQFNESSSSSCTTVDQIDPRTYKTIHLGTMSGVFQIATPDTNNDYVYHLLGGSCGQ
jgi:hypothetical protein